MTRALKSHLNKDDDVPDGLKQKEKQLTKMMTILYLIFLITYVPGVLVKSVNKSTYFDFSKERAIKSFNFMHFEEDFLIKDTFYQNSNAKNE